MLSRMVFHHVTDEKRESRSEKLVNGRIRIDVYQGFMPGFLRMWDIKKAPECDEILTFVKKNLF